ncbi:MAG: helix-turn-helix domain-containing protein [Acidobacteria bacterium]|nr:helix-turn-helix domain-containing protein [Acidobacteriota bacterium]
MRTLVQSEWLTAREAAAYLKVAHRTILEWAKKGVIPAHRLSGALRVTWRFRADELDGAMISAPSAAENGESFNATGK